MSRRRKSRVAPKGVQARSWVALMASKGTPAAVVATLNRSVNDVLRRPKSPKSSRPLALCQIPMTPAALASLIDSDIAAYAAMVKRTRISAD